MTRRVALSALLLLTIAWWPTNLRSQSAGPRTKPLIQVYEGPG